MMLKSIFYTELELENFGFKSLGKNVRISSDARIYGQENISIGNNVRIDDFVTLSATNGYIDIRNNVFIAKGCHLSGFYGIILSDFSSMAAFTTIYSASDDYFGNFLTAQAIPQEYTSHIGGTVNVGKHVIIGCHTTIIGQCSLGDGCSIGAMSLIVKDLDEWSIYAGVPARKIKDRSTNLLKLECELLKKHPEFNPTR